MGTLKVLLVFLRGDDVEQTEELPVIWDAMMQMWRRCKALVPIHHQNKT